MLIKDLKEVWVSQYTKTNDHGEKTKEYRFKPMETKSKTAFLNIQEELNEAYEKTSGSADYIIIKGITSQNYNIKKGDGISFVNIAEEDVITPEYIVTDCPRIGNTTIYKMETYNGEWYGNKIKL